MSAHPQIAQECDEPIHDWFNLTYANYLTLPRTVLQSAPVEWQRRFVACLRELDAMFDYLDFGPGEYDVRKRGDDGRWVTDPLSNYERGRRRVHVAKAEASQ